MANEMYMLLMLIRAKYHAWRMNSSLCFALQAANCSLLHACHLHAAEIHEFAERTSSVPALQGAMSQLSLLSFEMNDCADKSFLANLRHFKFSELAICQIFHNNGVHWLYSSLQSSSSAFAGRHTSACTQICLH